MAAKSKTRFTAKKIFLLAAVIILFSAVVSILVTAQNTLHILFPKGRRNSVDQR